jgi:hypothetical protein
VSPADSGATDRRGVHFGIYSVVMFVVVATATVGSFFWALAASMASDGCHGDDARAICTVEEQHWVVLLPRIALISAIMAASVVALVVVWRRCRAAWVWVGLPLSVTAYFAVPFLANWIRSVGKG